MQRVNTTQTPPGEPSLLHRIAAGDPSAPAEFIRLYAGLVWSLARRFERAEVEAAVAEVFQKTWRLAKTFDPAVASEAAFVAMIARRQLISRRRARGKPGLKIVPDPLRIADQTSQSSATCDEAARAARALSELAPEQRSVVVLATCHDMSHSEVSAQTGVPLPTVKARIVSGLRSIRAAVLGVSSRPRGEP